MESERMLYLVTEYASGGEIFGKLFQKTDLLVLYNCQGHLHVKWYQEVIFHSLYQPNGMCKILPVCFFIQYFWMTASSRPSLNFNDIYNYKKLNFKVIYR
jgi:hypothetical protein